MVNMEIAERCNYRDGNEKGIKFNRDNREYFRVWGKAVTSITQAVIMWRWKRLRLDELSFHAVQSCVGEVVTDN